MLKAHQACIDLEKNVLRIQGREVGFLSEHELPEEARIFEQGRDEEPGSQPSGSGSSNPAPTEQNQGSSFPGQGNTIGAAPRSQSQPRQPPASRYPESDVSQLMNLGATREEAIRLLDVSGGNVDIAASLLF